MSENKINNNTPNQEGINRQKSQTGEVKPFRRYNKPKKKVENIEKPQQNTEVAVIAQSTQIQRLPNTNNNGRTNQNRVKPDKITENTAHKPEQKIEASATKLTKTENPTANRQHRGKKTPPKEKRGTPVKIISLGGLNEIGKNITAYECVNDMFLVDCGLSFPDDDMLGIDLVIPDFTYLEKNIDKIRGLVITHGHEDHIGSIPYLIKKGINVPIYGTRLALSLIEGKLKEHGLLNKVKLHLVSAGTTIKLGCMAVEFIEVNHSIPDACALAIYTPAGIIVQTGDFKLDYTPVIGECINLARFGELGSRGVLALLPDSTNADKPGFSQSEKIVSESFDTLFKKAGSKRILIATFASNVHRIQTIFNCAAAHGRKVAVSGRSMENVVGKATEIGYLTYPEDMLIDIDNIKNYRDEDMVIITTGSQGEPMSALARMAANEHRKVSVTENDFIIISAHAIPGNEKLVNRLVNDLMRQGADVIYEKRYNTHVSGHACQEDLKLMMKLTKPKFVIPLHGEFKHLKYQKDLALSMGIPADNIIISDIGKVIETDGVDMKIVGSVPSGRVMVDGLGVGDVGSIVLRDRKHLSEDGLIVVVATIDSVTGEIVAGPDVVSRGFVYVRESEDMMSDAKAVCQKAISQCKTTGYKDWNGIKQAVKDQLGQYLYVKTKRSPMILPVIQEV